MPKRGYVESTEMSSTSHLISGSSLSSLIECPICLAVPRDGVMLMCLNGHNVCADCMDKIGGQDARCPTCRCGFHMPPAKNFTVAGLVKRLRLEWLCKNHAEPVGCQFKGSDTALEMHEASCEYRMISCPVYKCSTRMPANIILDHLMKDHDLLHNALSMDTNDCLDRLSAQRISNRFTDLDHGMRKAYFCSIPFAFITWHLQNGKLFLWLWSLLDEKAAAGFECQITLWKCIDEVDDTFPVYPIDWDRTRIMEDDRCLCIDQDHLDMMIAECPKQNEGGSDSFFLRIRVSKKN